MYNATLISKSIQRSKNSILFEVEFDNGTDPVHTKTFSLPLSGTEDSLKQAVKNYIDELQSAESSVSSISDGAIDLSTIPTPSPAKVEFVEWREKFARLQRVQVLIDLGIVSDTNPKVTALRNEIQTGLKASYIDLI